MNDACMDSRIILNSAAYDTADEHHSTSQPYYLRQLEAQERQFAQSNPLAAHSNAAFYTSSTEQSAVGAPDSTCDSSIVDDHFHRALKDGDYDFVSCLCQFYSTFSPFIYAKSMS